VVAVRLCDDTITVFNARADPETGGSVWLPVTIAGASWWATDASAVDAARGGLAAANKCVIRIPAEATARYQPILAAGGGAALAIAAGMPLAADWRESAYIDPVGYANAGSAAGLWTLKNGDIIVRAAVAGGDWTPAKLKRAFADCVTVLGVTDNRRAPKGKHWRVTGT